MSTTQTYTLLVIIYAIVIWLFCRFLGRIPTDLTRTAPPADKTRTLADKMGKIPCFYPDCSCSFETMVRGCGTRRDPMMMRQERVPGPTDDIAAPLSTRVVCGSSPVDTDSPPVAIKFPAHSNGHVVVCKRVLVIKQCPDPMMWYANLVGKEVPYLGEWKSTREYRSREPAGYINIVKFDDATIIVKEVK